MVLLALQPGSDKLPFLDGTHMLPILPGKASECACLAVCASQSSAACVRRHSLLTSLWCAIFRPADGETH